LLCIGGEIFYISEAVGLLYLPVTSGVIFSVPSALQPSRTMALCFDFVPPWQESPFVCHCRTGLEIIEESIFINIKHVLHLVSIKAVLFFSSPSLYWDL